jgi:hypothetical protein
MLVARTPENGGADHPTGFSEWKWANEIVASGNAPTVYIVFA